LATFDEGLHTFGGISGAEKRRQIRPQPVDGASSPCSRASCAEARVALTPNGAARSAMVCGSWQRSTRELGLCKATYSAWSSRWPDCCDTSQAQDASTYLF